MPHDNNGNLLAAGDLVYIPATVTWVGESPDGKFCNASVEFDYIMPGREFKDTYSAINTKQLIKRCDGEPNPPRV